MKFQLPAVTWTRRTWVRVLGSTFLAGTLLLGGCSSIQGDRIDPGYVALLVNSYGENRGIENAQLFEGGRVRYNFTTQELFEYPVFYKTFSFAKTEEGDKSVSFTVGGVRVSMDLGVTYRFKYEPIDPKNPNFTYLHEFFRFYRVDPEKFNDGALRNALRDCATESASGLNPVKLLSDVAAFSPLVKQCLDTKFRQIDFKEVSILSQPVIPKNIQDSIDKSFQSQQDAQTALANKAKAEAEAGANIATANGEAQVKRIQADADAYVNATLAKSITPALIDYERLQVQKVRAEKWNGVEATTVQSANTQVGNSSDPQQ